MRTYTIAEMELMDYCRWDYDKQLIKLLGKHHDLDVTVMEGLCFQLAIKHKNANILNALLDFYQKTNLQCDRDNIEYKKASYKLWQILQDAISSFDVSPEIQEILNPYIATTDSDDEQDLSGFDDIDSLDSVEHTTDSTALSIKTGLERYK
jgi:hypothetical protein